MAIEAKMPASTRECILTLDGEIYEGLTSNICFVILSMDTLIVITPPTNLVLPGIMLKRVRRACLGMNIAFEERVLHVDSLSKLVLGCFITSKLKSRIT